ncbi:nicotinamide riboside transporter PnuC [uncultured Acetatifactor sp.]|jgi:nicotinamide mononucleotide transporter|uniref:nicotinamide riboside transporter PnuC n=1 Tax=uncultured Acetatifactor sp. TaxID=1671927 RepID=UPI00262DC7B3|nr:nicotinamide riboside transporter PnuC [uncultured Acetatifactor sp.]
MIYENIKKSFRELKWYEYLMGAIMIFIAARAMVIGFTTGSADGNPPWLTVINFISAVCGVICIFFTAKANISNFVFASVNTIVYAVYLVYWHIWGTALLEILFYIPMNFVSWYFWAKHRDREITQKTKSRRLTLLQNGICAAVVVASALIYHGVLVKVGGEVAWFDAFTLSIGILATILELLRYKEQYIWWIITDIVSIGMYIAHFDMVYLTKRSIYLIMAVIGLMNWAKLNRTRNVENE